MSVKEKVFCLGFSKTGTTSLEQALETLGYNVCKGNWRTNHTFYLLALFVNRDYDELLRMTKYWDAFADGPWGGTDLYIKLLETYPNAKYILTIRPPEKWYASFQNLITLFDSNLDTALSSYHANGLWGSGYYFESLFNIKSLAGNKQKIIDAYVKYNNDVIAYFHHQNKELLILDLSHGNSWEVICSFLKKDIPSIPFPHINKSGDANPANLSQIDNMINEQKSLENQIWQLVKKTLRPFKRLF